MSCWQKSNPWPRWKDRCQVGWFVYTWLGQWLSRLLNKGWCFIRKDDPRFIVSVLRLDYDGDSSAAPDDGSSSQVRKWKDWVLFKVPTYVYRNGFVVIDIYDGRRLACFYKSKKSLVFAIRAGHEPGVIRLGIPASCDGGDHFGGPEFLARWREGEPWPLENTPQERVTFI